MAPKNPDHPDGPLGFHPDQEDNRLGPLDQPNMDDLFARPKTPPDRLIDTSPLSQPKNETETEEQRRERLARILFSTSAGVIDKQIPDDENLVNTLFAPSLHDSSHRASSTCCSFCSSWEQEDTVPMSWSQPTVLTPRRPPPAVQLTSPSNWLTPNPAAP